MLGRLREGESRQEWDGETMLTATLRQNGGEGMGYWVVSPFDGAPLEEEVRTMLEMAMEMLTKC